MTGKVFRKIGAYILLTVFLMMTVFTDFHRHKIVSPGTNCEYCEHNLPHPNHFSQSYSYQDICLLCQWAAQEFELAHSIDVVASKIVLMTFDNCAITDCQTEFIKLFSDRAPPRV